jgi:hypothetical protein
MPRILASTPNASVRQRLAAALQPVLANPATRIEKRPTPGDGSCAFHAVTAGMQLEDGRRAPRPLQLRQLLARRVRSTKALGQGNEANSPELRCLSLQVDDALRRHWTEYRPASKSSGDWGGVRAGSREAAAIFDQGHVAEFVRDAIDCRTRTVECSRSVTLVRYDVRRALLRAIVCEVDNAPAPSWFTKAFEPIMGAAALLMEMQGLTEEAQLSRLNDALYGQGQEQVT